MANYTALVDVKVDVGRANKAFKNIEGSLLRVSKATKSTNAFLSRMENTFTRMEKTFGKIHRAQSHQINQLKKMGSSAGDTSAKIAELEAKVKKLEKSLKSTTDAGKKQLPIFKSLAKAYKQNAYLIQSMASAFIGFLQFNIVGALRRMTDQFTLMGNRIRMVDDSFEGFNKNMATSFKLAQEIRVPLFQVGNTLARIGRVSKTLKDDLGKLATVVSTVGKAFQIGGATIEEANNAMIQLSQAFASGRLQGDELRSVLELAPRLAEGIAKSIGITVGTLRQYAKEGKLTTKVLELAILEASSVINKEFGKIDQTIGQSLTKVGNSFMKLVGETAKANKITSRFAQSFNDLTVAIDKLKGGAIVTAIAKGFGLLADNLNAILAIVTGGGLLLGLGSLLAVLIAIGSTLGGPLLGALTLFSTAVGGLAYAFREDLFGGGIKTGLARFGKDFNKQLENSKKRLDQNAGSIKKLKGELSNLELTRAANLPQDMKDAAKTPLIFRLLGKKQDGPGRILVEIEKKTKQIAKLEKESGQIVEDRASLENQIADAKTKAGLAQAEFLRLSEAELSNTKAINAERLKYQSAINKERIRSASGRPDPFAEQRIRGLADVGVNTRTQISDIIKKFTGVSAGQTTGQMINLQTGALNLKDRRKELFGGKGISSRITEGGENFIGTAGLKQMNNEIDAVVNNAQTKIKLLLDEIRTSAEVSNKVAIRSAKDQTALAVARLNSELQITGKGNIQDQQIERDHESLKLAGKIAQQKALQQGHDSVTALAVSRQAVEQQKITNQLRQQAMIRKNQQVSAGLKLGEAFGGVSGANQEAMMRGTGQITGPGKFNPRVFGFGGGQDASRKNFFSETEGHNKRMLDIAKKMGISEDKLFKVKVKNHGIDQEKLYFDEESINLKGAYLDMFNNEVESSNQILKNQQNKNELDEAASAVPGDVKAAQGIGMLGSATGGPAGGRASNIANAYAAGGGGLTGALNALVAMLMGNKKIMEALEKVFAMVFDVLDLLMDPIGELLGAIGTVLKPVFNILRPIFQMFGKLFKILQGVLKPIGQIFEMLNMFIAPLMAVMQAILGFLNALVGGLMETIIQPLMDALMRAGGLDPDGYKPQVLLEEEAKILDKIEGSLEGAADALKEINDVVFDITQSALNLAAPAIKAEDATEKYEELKRAAMRAGATEDAINEFTGYASTYLQVQQDILKSSGAYQTIYEAVINDLQGLQRGISETVGDELTRTLKQATLDLDLVGSDLGHVIREVASQMESGAITFSQFIDFVSFKAGQVDKDLALYEILATADLGEDAGYIQSTYLQTMGPAESGYAGFNFGGGSNKQSIRNAVAADFKAMDVEALIVNPTHYAVGLTRNSDGSVSVSAVGEDAMALEMIAAANANGVPVIRDPETARALATGSGSTSGTMNLVVGSTAVMSGVNALAPSIGNLGSGVGAATGGGSSSMFSLPDMDIGKLFSALVQGIIDGIANAFQQIGDLAGELMNAIFGWINQLGLGIHDFLNAIMQPIFGLIGQLNIADFIFGIFQPIIKLGSINPADWILGIFSPLRGLVVDGVEFLGKLLDPVLGAITGALGGLSDVIGSALQPVFDGLSGAFSGIMDTDIMGMGSLSDGVDTYINYTQDLFEETVGLITDIFNLDFGSAGQRISDAFGNLGKVVEDALAAIGIDLDFGDIGKEIAKLGTSIIDGISDLFSGGVDLFSGFTGLGGLLQDAVSSLFSLGGGSGDEIKLLPNPFHGLGIGPSHFIKFKFAEGGALQGLAKGPSHGAGGIPGVVGGRTPIEFEGGEYIMSKKAVDNIGVGAMNMINEAGKSYAAGGVTTSQAEQLMGKPTGQAPEFINVSPEIGGTLGDVLKRINMPRGFHFKASPISASGGLTYAVGGHVGHNLFSAFTDPSDSILTQFRTPSNVTEDGQPERSAVRADLTGYHSSMSDLDFANWYKWGSVKGPGYPESFIPEPAYQLWQKQYQGSMDHFMQNGTFTHSAVRQRSSFRDGGSTRMMGGHSYGGRHIDYSGVPKDSLFIPSHGYMQFWGNATRYGGDSLGYRLTTGQDLESIPVQNRGNDVYGGNTKINPWMQIWRLTDSGQYTRKGLADLHGDYAERPYGYNNPIFSNRKFASTDRLPSYAADPQGGPVTGSFRGMEFAHPYAHSVAASQYQGRFGNLARENPDNLAKYLAMSFGLGQSAYSIPNRDLQRLRGNFSGLTARMPDGKTKGGSRQSLDVMYDPYVVFSYLWDTYRNNYNLYGHTTDSSGNVIGGAQPKSPYMSWSDYGEGLSSFAPQHSQLYYDMTMGLNHPYQLGAEGFKQEEANALSQLFSLIKTGQTRGFKESAIVDMMSSSYSDILTKEFFAQPAQVQTGGAGDAVNQNRNLVREPEKDLNDLLLLDLDKRFVAEILGLPVKAVDTVVKVFEKVPILGWLGGVIGHFVRTVYETVTSIINPRVTAQLGMRMNPPSVIMDGGISYGRGGLIHGPDHAHGGKAIYAEGGEYIVNKNATKKNLGLLHRINYQEGGTTYNPGSNFARQDIDFTGAGAYFSNVQESVQNLTQGSVGDITNLYSREVELNKELTDLFTQLGDEMLRQLAELRDGIYQNLEIQLAALSAVGEAIKQNVSFTVQSSTDNQAAHLYNYFVAINDNVSSVGDMAADQFNKVQQALFLNFMSTTSTIGNYLKQITSTDLTQRELPLVPGSGVQNPDYLTWSNDAGQIIHTIGPGSFKEGGLVGALKYAAGGSTPTVSSGSSNKNQNILGAVLKNNADLYSVGGTINTNLGKIHDQLANNSARFDKIDGKLASMSSGISSGRTIGGQIQENYNAIVDLSGKFQRSPGGIVGGVVDGVGGIINKVGGAIGGIFSDRGVKNFRGGGMTESQQTDLLRKVQPQTYRYKSGGPVQTGFMAQDLERSSFGRQFVHSGPAGKYVDGGIIGPLIASQSIMQSRMDSYQGGGVVASSGISEQLLQGIIDAIRDQDMNVNVYTNTEDEVGQMLGSQSASQGEASYRGVSDYA